MEQLHTLAQKQLLEYWMKKVAANAEWPVAYWEAQREVPLLLTASLNPEVLEPVQELARNKVSEYTLFFSLYAVLLYRYFGKNYLLVAPDLKLFPPSVSDHLLFYLAAVSEEKTLKQVIVDFQQEVMTVLDKRDFDVYNFLQAARLKGLDTASLQSFGFLHTGVNEEASLPGEERWKLVIENNYDRYQLQLYINGVQDASLLGQQFLRHYEYLLVNVKALLGQRIADIQLPTLTTPVLWNNTDADTLLTLLQQQVTQRPTQTAVVSRGQHLSYASLDADSSKVAAWLGTQQIGKGDVVGLLLPRSEWIVTGIWSAWKAGAAFVPLDPAWPASRLQYILEDAGAKALLTTTDYLPQVKAFKGKLFAFDIQLDILPDSAKPSVDVQPQDTAYVMYTSGTTGQPKGVLIPHAGVVNYAKWLQESFEAGPAQSSALITSYAFDLGYTSIWGTLPWGGTLHIPEEDFGKMPDQLHNYLAKHAITFIKVTPSLFHLLLHAASHTTSASRLALQRVFLGGEMIRPADLATFHTLYPDTKFVNHYGPTECTVGCIAHPVNLSALDAFASRPVIGKPIRHTQVVVLDENQHIVPDGIWGELAVSSPGVADGYLNQPVITATKFMPLENAVTGTVYRTGDYGRYLENGTIALKGRKDNQAKIRGYRVELEEIEKCLATYPGIRETAVLLGKITEDAPVILTAFYTTADAHTVIPVEKIQEFLRERLPEYMLPADLIAVPAMPVNENGKLNRKQLSEWALNGIKTSRQQVVPANEVENTLLQVWKKVLQREDISTTDGFFELGGNSLLLVQVNMELNAVFPALSITDLFAYTSIVTLAAFISQDQAGVVVNTASSAIRLPASYLQAADAAPSTLYVKLEAAATANLKEIAARLKLEVFDLAVGAFAYVLSRAASINLVPLHLSDATGQIKRTSLDLQEINEPTELFLHAGARRAAPADTFSLNNILHTPAADIEPGMVWPLVRLHEQTVPPKGIFDLLLTVQDKHTQLAFSLDYASHLQPEKIESLLTTLVEVLEYSE